MENKIYGQIIKVKIKMIWRINLWTVGFLETLTFFMYVFIATSTPETVPWTTVPFFNSIATVSLFNFMRNLSQIMILKVNRLRCKFLSNLTSFIFARKGATRRSADMCAERRREFTMINAGETTDLLSWNHGRDLCSCTVEKARVVSRVRHNDW